jgi:predicted MFS family arabinose efflux permease
MVLGPALGGIVCSSLGGARTVYAVSAAMALSALVLVAQIESRPRTIARPFTDLSSLLGGVRYVTSSPIVFGAISLDLFAVLLGGATALLPVYARDILHLGPSALGVLRSAPAIGGATMAVVLALRPIRRHVGRALLLCVALFGVGTMIFGVSRSFIVSLAALIVLGAADMVSVFVRSSLVQLATPEAMRGRVSAISMLFIGASNELGEVESGVTAQWFGTVPAVVLGGIGTLVIVVVWSWLFPSLRRVDRLSDIAA